MFVHSVKRAKLLIENGYEVEFRGVAGNLDTTKLPDALVARVAAGENVHAVPASDVARAWTRNPSSRSPRVAAGGPDEDGETRLGPDDNRRDGGKGGGEK
jgi:hypothetical protein